MALSDATNNNLISFNGMGASADIFFETPYKSKLGKKSILTVSANNIGFIHWNNKSIQYSSDSSLRFIGYKIKNNKLFSFLNSSYNLAFFILSFATRNAQNSY